MKIYILTPIYATTTQGAGATPIVHYFTKEWVKQGHEVTVFNFRAKYPSVFYFVSKRLQHKINSALGQLVPVEVPKDFQDVSEGVKVYSKVLSKVIPHGRYRKSQINKAVRIVSRYCEEQGMPDVFIGHWDSPQLEILARLKDLYGAKTCLVFHNNEFDFEKKYGREFLNLISRIDIVGFRNISAQKDFSAKYGSPKRSFIAYSGVSESFIESGKSIDKKYNSGIHKFIFTGSLIKRKFPAEILIALSKAYPDGDFEITFIGDGAEKESIISLHEAMGRKGSVKLTGRIPREEVVEYLKKADVFVMISKNEIFGLVYLEAMALGLIPIGSKNEGIDGIIVNGENGFLCEAGNVKELEGIITNLKNSSSDRLKQISDSAKLTAIDYSDRRVAGKYIDNIVKN